MSHTESHAKMASKNSLDQLKAVSLEGIEPTEKVLGCGAYGKVFIVKHAGLICAAKEVHPILISGVGAKEKESVTDRFIQECVCCSTIRHPNIVLFIGVYFSDKSGLPILVMEKMKTSVTKFVDKNKSKIPMKTKEFILHDISLGLRYLHQNRKPPIIHRDLSSNNILLSEDMVAKISDLGMAKMICADSKQTKMRLTKLPGTVDFMPPETLLNEPSYGTPVDIFSFAAIAVHLFSEEWPTPLDLMKKDPNKTRPIALLEVERRQKYIDKMTGEAARLKSLVIGCLENDPDDRPGIAEIIKQLTVSQCEQVMVVTVKIDNVSMISKL